MAKRLSEKQIENIIKLFFNGKTIDELSKEFKRTKLTITRNLKNKLGESEYKGLIKTSRSSKKSFDNDKKLDSIKNENHFIRKNHKENNSSSEPLNELEDELSPITPFMEISPLDFEFENKPQKDLSSVHISDISFPKIVYMIVDKKIELETKYLKDYPEWQFLSKVELQRKTIQIYFDLKIAKRSCVSEKKVIKVPNPEVFKIVAPILLSKGISRIVSEDKLIAL